MLMHLSFPVHSAGQCGNGLITSTYDTVVTGPGYGNYQFSFPKWHPDSGTLVSVKINAQVSLNYGFTLKNSDIVPSIYTIRVGRLDKITSPAMATYSKTVEQLIGDFPLDPGNSVSMPPFSFMDQYPNIDSITTAIAPFLGFDNVQFVYSPVTYTDLRTNNNSSYSYHAAAPDTVRFSVTYLHCPASTLALTLASFTIDPEGPAALRLAWRILNEQPGRSYEIEQGRDGQHFAVIGSLPSVTGNNNAVDYQFAYGLAGGGVGKWYFRLKMNDGHGGATYSEIKEFDAGLPGSGGPSLWPNPANNYVNLLFARPSAGNWQVDLYDAAGNRVQSEVFVNARAGRLDFRRKLAAGTYFVRITDQRTQQVTALPLLVSQ